MFDQNGKIGEKSWLIPDQHDGILNLNALKFHDGKCKEGHPLLNPYTCYRCNVISNIKVQV